MTQGVSLIMKNSTEITYVAMDVHKKKHSVAMILPGSDQITEWTIHNNDREIKRMIKRLEKVAPGKIEICYEAGVCGFALQRKLSTKRIKCMVIAPSLVPCKPGERVKTDRRDARKLVKYLMAGQLRRKRHKLLEVYSPQFKADFKYEKRLLTWTLISLGLSAYPRAGGGTQLVPVA